MSSRVYGRQHDRNRKDDRQSRSHTGESDYRGRDRADQQPAGHPQACQQTSHTDQSLGTETHGQRVPGKRIRIASDDAVACRRGAGVASSTFAR